jgi:hypothetical protein
MSAANHYSDERMRKLLAVLRCPDCGEQNMPNKKELIELDANGVGYCNKCGMTWLADPLKSN